MVFFQGKGYYNGIIYLRKSVKTAEEIKKERMYLGITF